MAIKPNAVWIDFNNDFTVDIEPELVDDVKAINKALQNLFNTMIGTRPFMRDYGSHLPFYRQEPIDDKTASDIRVSLLSSIRRWEPRVVIDTANTKVIADTKIPGYRIDLPYSIPSLKRPGRLQFVARSLQ